MAGRRINSPERQWSEEEEEEGAPVFRPGKAAAAAAAAVGHKTTKEFAAGSAPIEREPARGDIFRLDNRVPMRRSRGEIEASQ